MNQVLIIKWSEIKEKPIAHPIKNKNYFFSAGAETGTCDFTKPDRINLRNKFIYFWCGVTEFTIVASY
jgi:hypothetical protein